MENKKVPAYIDDKNVIEDWEFLTDGYEISDTRERLRKVAFFNRNCLWVIEYVIGFHEFELKCMDYNEAEGYLEESSKDIKERLDGINDPNIVLEYTQNGLSSFQCAFYFSEEALS